MPDNTVYPENGNGRTVMPDVSQVESPDQATRLESPPPSAQKKAEPLATAATIVEQAAAPAAGQDGAEFTKVNSFINLMSKIEESSATAMMGATQVDAKMANAKELAPEDSAELKPGQVLGKCRIVKELGRGGMGAVYLAEHTTLEVKVAVKILPPSIAVKNKQFAERFMREARLAAKIQHGNVIQVMDAEQDAGTGLYYIVMEFVNGGSVKDLMREGPMDQVQAIDIVMKVADALTSAADMHIVHRDIKPDNIMLTEKGQVKLADLGIAKEKSSEAPGITMSSVMMGTPAYMSPEQAMDAKNADARADIYSLGATLYHMLVGEVPFNGETTYSVLTKLATEPTPDPRKKRSDLNDNVANICMRMMAKEKEDRPQNAADLMEELMQVRSILTTGVGTVITKGTIGLKMAKNPKPQSTPTVGMTGTAFGQPVQPQQPAVSYMPYICAAACALVIMGGIGWWMLSGDDEENHAATPNVSQAAPDTTNVAQAPVTQPAETPITPVAPVANVTPTNPVKPVIPTQPNEITPPAVTTTPTQPVAPVTVQEPVDADFVKQAMDELEKAPAGTVKVYFKNNQKPKWPQDTEFKLASLGDSPEAAEKAAYTEALTELLAQVVASPDQMESQTVKNMLEKSDKYIQKASEFKTGEKDGLNMVAIGLTPLTGKIGQELYKNDVKVRDFYELVGRPRIGVDLKTIVATGEGEKPYSNNLVLKRIEKALGASGVEIVALAGENRKEMMKECDLLLTGTCVAREAVKLPDGANTIYRYNLSVDAELIITSTANKVPLEQFNFDTGGDLAEEYATFNAAQAAQKVIENGTQKLAPVFCEKMLEEWISFASDIYYTVEISGLQGGDDLEEARTHLEKIDGITKVHRRSYADNTLTLGVAYSGTAVQLCNLIRKNCGLRLDAQSGMRLKFVK
jgi:serine/threonine protein kinase